jgi:hypothetical protein
MSHPLSFSEIPAMISLNNWLLPYDPIVNASGGFINSIMTVYSFDSCLSRFISGSASKVPGIFRRFHHNFKGIIIFHFCLMIPHDDIIIAVTIAIMS